MEELQKDWWNRWKIQCFDSLFPIKSWTHEQRGVKEGDVVLISYSDKSKSGTYRLGIVLQVEYNSDNLVRTCEVKTCQILFQGFKIQENQSSSAKTVCDLASGGAGVPTIFVQAIHRQS